MITDTSILQAIVEFTSVGIMDMTFTHALLLCMALGSKITIHNKGGTTGE